MFISSLPLFLPAAFYRSGDPVLLGGTEDACEVDAHNQLKNGDVCDIQLKCKCAVTTPPHVELELMDRT